MRHSFGMERAGVVAKFEAQARYARKHLPRAQLAAALRAIKQQRETELAALDRRQALEVRSRLTAARKSWQRHHLPQKPN